MGSGRWSTDVYDAHNRMKRASGKSTFDYSDMLHRRGTSTWKVHDSLNPYGVKARESRDSDEHPESNAIVVLFDVTGSMGQVPVTLQTKLPELLGLLLRKSYISDPQILFGAIGDATCDRVPLQVGQFESDNRMDENLENIFLEGGGGGQQTESYELAMYFVERHTELDCWNKRGRKGYFFIIGDEMAYSLVKRREVQEHIGDGMQRDLPIAELINNLRQRYHVFYILPSAASYGGDPKILGFWRKLLGQYVLELADAEAVCETIALTIGLTEGTIDLPAGIMDMEDMAVAPETVQAVSRVLQSLPAPTEEARIRGFLPGLDSSPRLSAGSK